jgi:hypothetical protein
VVEVEERFGLSNKQQLAVLQPDNIPQTTEWLVCDLID